MTVKDIIEKLDLQGLNEANLDAEVKGAYASDLLSDVMGNARSGQVWITMQTHKNVTAIASLRDLPAVIIVRGDAGIDTCIFINRHSKASEDAIRSIWGDRIKTKEIKKDDN